MEDYCAVCAEPLEWVAIGPCNHRDVCSTCVARLRLVMKDKRCCHCRQEADAVFVTKFLGDYTKPPGDFSQLPEPEISRGRAGGDLWYDPDIKAYFDDKDHWKAIQAMNRLSCSVCEHAEGDPVPVPLSATRGPLPKNFTFRTVDALKRHYHGAHKLVMCDLCLEGRKNFISEQKLYTRAQLEKHAVSGNSEVDGTEEERGGFNGHPMCQFCKKRFYGDNELYQHMTQEHYTCFLCQRARPGSYEYFSDYRDLEVHFRGEHHLCEDPSCLERKFVVFAGEQELKRHNVQQHGGSMSRAERNRALQIPASQLFNFARRPSHDGAPSQRRGPRGRQPGGPSVALAPHPEALEASMRASVETADLEAAMRESAALADSTDAQRARANRLEAERSSRATGPEGAAPATTTPPPAEAFPSLSAQDLGLPGSSSAYANTVHRSGPALVEEYFPPLPGSSKSAKKRAKEKEKGRASSSSSMASLLGGGQSLPLGPSGGQPRLHLGASPSSGILRNPGVSRPPPPLVSSTPNWVVPPVGASTNPGPPPGAGRWAPGGGDSGSSAAGGGAGGGQAGAPLTGAVQLSMGELKAANKALVESIRQGLGGNEEQFADFKRASAEFRRGELSSVAFYDQIAGLGLSYVVPELARLCPDPVKRRELVAAHAAAVLKDPQAAFSQRGRSKDKASSSESSSRSSSGSGERIPGPGKPSGRGAKASLNGLPAAGRPGEASRANGDEPVAAARKGKAPATSNATPGGSSGVTGGQAAPSSTTAKKAKGKEKVEVVILAESASQASQGSRDPGQPGGMRGSVSLPDFSSVAHSSAQSTDPVPAPPSPAPEPDENTWNCNTCTLQNDLESKVCAACGSSRPRAAALQDSGSGANDSKKKKKAARFDRLRLGDPSAAHFFSTGPSIEPPSVNPWGQSSGPPPPGAPRGAWRGPGGQRVVALAQREETISDAWGRTR